MAKVDIIWLHYVMEQSILKKALVHRLVAEAFLSNPNNLPEVNHIDYNCKNNAASNLEWCTRVYNMQHCFKKHSQVRNYKPCAIYQDGHFIKKISKHCRGE